MVEVIDAVFAPGLATRHEYKFLAAKWVERVGYFKDTGFSIVGTTGS
ncbi:MAG: hypothetical protein ACREV1_11430 [Gammaproteobacteria bacterium]